MQGMWHNVDCIFRTGTRWQKVERVWESDFGLFSIVKDVPQLAEMAEHCWVAVPPELERVADKVEYKMGM
jgi:hypothetical protein